MAFAHTTLLRSEPAAGSRSATSPERVRLVFSEALEPSLAQLSIVDVAGSVVRLSASGDPHDVNAIVAPLSALAPGSYRLRWRVVSADGHPVEGSFTFSVGVESAAAMAPPVPLPADEESIVWGPSVGGAPLIPAALRGVALGTLMALAGVLSFIAWPRSTDRVVSRRANRVAMVCAVAAPLLLVLHFGAWAMNADAAHQLSSESLSAALATSVGRVELWRTGLALVALWAVALARRPGLALPFAVAALVVSGATGHAAAISPLYATPAKALHLVAAALWAGGLLWLLCLDRQDVDQFIRETLRVSSVALAGVVIVMLSGIVQTLLFLPTLSDLLTSAYGALVLAKVFGMLILIAFGAHHRFRVLPLLRSDAQSPTRLVVTVRREVVVFGVVVLLGGLLAYVPPALHSASHAAHSHIISP
ncbi:MAG: copper resistance protein CopC [bacterium]